VRCRLRVDQARTKGWRRGQGQAGAWWGGQRGEKVPGEEAPCAEEKGGEEGGEKGGGVAVQRKAREGAREGTREQGRTGLARAKARAKSPRRQERGRGEGRGRAGEGGQGHRGGSGCTRRQERAGPKEQRRLKQITEDTLEQGEKESGDKGTEKEEVVAPSKASGSGKGGKAKGKGKAKTQHRAVQRVLVGRQTRATREVGRQRGRGAKEGEEEVDWKELMKLTTASEPDTLPCPLQFPEPLCSRAHLSWLACLRLCAHGHCLHVRTCPLSVHPRWQSLASLQ